MRIAVRKSSLWVYAAWVALIWALGLTPAIKALTYQRTFGIDYQDAFVAFSSSQGGLASLVDSGLNSLMLGLGGVIVGVIVLRELASRKARLPRNGLWLWLGALAFGLGTVLSSRFGTEPSFSPVFFGLPLVFTAAYLLPSVPLGWFVRRVKAVLLFYAYGSLLAALVASQWALEYPYTQGLVPGLSVRLHGLTSHANALAGLLAVYLILSWFSPARTRWERPHQVVILLALILTQSKTVWLVLVLAYMLRLAYTTWSLPKLQRYATLALLGTSFSGGIFYLISGLALPDSVEATLSDEQVVTLTGRTLIWQVTLEQWKLNPLFGYGPNLWDLQMSMANVPTIGFVASHAHNQVVQTLGEAGVVGGVGLLLYVAALLAYGVRYARATNVVALALVSVMLLRGITEPSLNHTLGTGDFYGHFLIFTYLVLASRHDNLTQSCKTGLAGRAS